MSCAFAAVAARRGVGLRNRGHQVFNANCAACHAGGQNSVVADHTLEKAAIEKFLTGGFKEASVATQVPSLPRLSITSCAQSAVPFPCSATVSSLPPHVTTAGVVQAAGASLISEGILLVFPAHLTSSSAPFSRPLTSNIAAVLTRGTLPPPYPYPVLPYYPPSSPPPYR